MKQRLVFPRQRVGLICVGTISPPQILLQSFLLFTFLLSPIAAGAVDITQQLHRPLNSSVGRQLRDEADSLLSIGEQQYASGYADKTISTNELQAIDGLVTAHTAVGRYERASNLLKQRLALAKELQNLREQLKSFESYAQLYKQQGS